MPKEITKYLCKVCGAEYYDEKDAIECENIEVDNIDEIRDSRKSGSELIYIESTNDEGKFEYLSVRCDIIGEVIMKNHSLNTHHIAIVIKDPDNENNIRLAYFDGERNQWVSSYTMIFVKEYYDYYLDFMKSIE